ncbi:MAG TPA: VCBS repeat-containing protein [Candidatus Sulfotelmatobacter sp.]|nr:VCBS repeat-containing protein [Candidatus Sulfotelmatobacter sp.]
MKCSSFLQRHYRSACKPLGLLGLLVLAAPAVWAGGAPVWQQLSSKRGELPAPPGGSTQQTGAVVADFDGDGLNDFILSFRQKGPALVWYRRTPTGWDTYVIEKDYLTVEAGGAVYDIDGDGDLDVVFGGDWQSNEVWWWENPAPHFDRNVPWKRHLIKKGGKPQHHDQVFGDFLGTGKSQLAFWNQQAKTLYLAEIPDHPREAESWPLTEIISGTSAGSSPYTEGMSAFDVDGDGKVDLLAYNTWFKHTGGTHFKPIKLGETGGLIFAGHFKPGKVAQIVMSPGDGSGPVRWYECTANPEDPQAWVGHDLLDRPVVHGHSLQLGDINRDGHLDIFLAEMAKWSENKPEPDRPKATAWIFYGDGQGHFTKSELAIGHGWHEARLADLDGDGDLDLLNKPYTWDTPRVDVWLNNGTAAGARLKATRR